MSESHALKIALEALLELQAHPVDYASDALLMHDIAICAIRDIQREHYLDSPSPVVAEVIGARKL